MTKDALIQGYTAARMIGARFYKGRPCAAGHDGTRRVTNKACVPCSAAYDAARRAAMTPEQSAAERVRKLRVKAAWRKRNPAARLEECRAYRDRKAASPEQIERNRVRTATRAMMQDIRAIATNAAREARLARSMERKAATKERQRARNRLKQKRRRHAKRLYVDPHAARDRDVALLLHLQGGSCAYCGSKGAMHLDHMYPVTLGGLHRLINLQWLCAPCNLAKSSTPDSVYRIARGIPRVTPWDGIRLFLAFP